MRFINVLLTYLLTYLPFRTDLTDFQDHFVLFLSFRLICLIRVTDQDDLMSF